MARQEVLSMNPTKNPSGNFDLVITTKKNLYKTRKPFSANDLKRLMNIIKEKRTVLIERNDNFWQEVDTVEG
jgi:hypothetical protein